jgi:hypothetical protein
MSGRPRSALTPTYFLTTFTLSVNYVHPLGVIARRNPVLPAGAYWIARSSRAMTARVSDVDGERYYFFA